jgi:hypothetical protein
MDAQLHGYVIGDLLFQAHGDYSTSTNEITYWFGAYFIYNIGYSATTQILSLFDWALGPQVAYPSNKSIELYYKEGSIPLSVSSDEETNSQATGERTFIPQAHDGSSEDQIGNDISVWFSPATGLYPRADDDQNGRSAQFSQPLTCPARGSGDIRVPKLRCRLHFLPLLLSDIEI